MLDLLRERTTFTFCVDPLSDEQLWSLHEIPGVRVWDAHTGSTWARVPYNAAAVVGRIAGYRFPSLPPPDALFPAPKVNLDSFNLRSYQMDAVDHFNSPECNQRLLLADVMGLGKSRTAAACLVHRPGRKLIVGPKLLRATWRKELASVLPDEPFHYVESVNPSEKQWSMLPPPEEVRWLFCHYDILEAWWSFLRRYQFTGVILDEVHLVKNPKTRRGKGAMLAAGAIPARVALTGTPIENRVGELHNVLGIVQGSYSWGSRSSFRKRYAGAYENDFGGLVDDRPTHVDELRERMQGCYLRRTISDVQLELPPIIRSAVPVAASTVDMAKLEKMITPEAAHALRYYEQTGHLPGGDAGALKAVGKLRKAVSRLKIDATVNVATTHLEDGGNIVIFCWERAVAERIARAVQKSTGSEGRVVTGAMSQNARDTEIDRFRRDCADGHQVLVATYGALGVGVNLQSADATIMHDLEWVPGVLLQAEARVYRGGQTRSVRSFWMVGERTFDEFIMRNLLRKADDIAGAIADHEPEKLREAFGDYAKPRNLPDPFALYEELKDFLR